MYSLCLAYVETQAAHVKEKHKMNMLGNAPWRQPPCAQEYKIRTKYFGMLRHVDWWSITGSSIDRNASFFRIKQSKPTLPVTLGIDTA